ncbi:hypothetical protein K227x_23160 [Rubripirellula lacrimiformis]|uniref:Uncharacterized protein n=1 Tax=Rubripirellula lacrimiformis TaxID=1930273 RepID=A0A517N9X7_9BACT|nr:hypothetical protein K227x_23160 [Rubripirellula lacrimiformis]
MTVEQFRQQLSRAQLHPNDWIWMPPWIEEFARLQHSAAERLHVEAFRVLALPSTLHDRGVLGLAAFAGGSRRRVLPSSRRMQ